MTLRPILSLSTEALAAWLAERGEPAYRAAQIRRWLFAQRAAGFESMTDLPQGLRDALAAEFCLFEGRVVAHRTADDGTEKLLLEWPDTHRIECVLIREGARRTICISTQVGCAMGCVFCASGLDGVARNLTTAEILEQMLRLDRLQTDAERLSNIVVMGMGEPLANLPNLLPALEAAHDPRGLGISHRKITISTVGLPAAIDKLIEADCHYHLAVSLHAPNDPLRSEIVPVNRKTGLAEVLAAADRYYADNRRRLTFEYVLLGELNDRPQHARELAALLRGRNALLNVIPYNPVAGLPYRSPAPAALEAFLAILERAGVQVQVRVRKGAEIDAACGQLRRSFVAGPAVTPLEVPARPPAAPT